MANVQDLPIDIHSGKLLDWLISRRHCQKDWQKNVLVIREKIKHAILDMPESEEVLQLLQGSYINFFHCQRIIEILKETEKDSKNFLGYYSSQRMKDWQEIDSLYKKNNVYLAESAQILQRLAQYEIPSQKKQIAKAEQVLAESIKKEKEYARQAEDGRKLYSKELQRIGIKGHALRAELLALAANLPSFYSQITDDIINLKAAYEYYADFRSYIHQGMTPSGKLLPLMQLLLKKGSAVTAFEYKYGAAPSRIELPSYNLLLKEDEKKSDDEIDFGDEGIDFGDDAEIDFGIEETHIDIVADTEGAVGESVAVGEDALGVVENLETQKVIKNELNELLAFLSMRKGDEERDTSSDVFIRGFEKRPAEISKVTTAQMGEWITAVKAIIGQLSDQQKIHLFRIRTSPQYVEKLVEEIEAKKGLEARYKKMQNLMVEKQSEAQEQAAKAGQALQTLVSSTKTLQKQLEEEISKKYDGRRVNIMGGITAALANRRRMSISWGAQYPKLKTNLRLAINRLKLMGKKKTEMAMKARTEIAAYISDNKADRARIRVEHIIREDYLVEAFEILEMYCDLLLARFGLIEQMKTLDDGIAEAVISILWAAPRIATDIAEFRTISDQLTVKYGKPFAEAARANQLEFPAKVSPKLIAKLSVAAPPKVLVERYMIEIASSAGVPFVPDPDVMRDDEVAQAEKMLIDFKQAGGLTPAAPEVPQPAVPPPVADTFGYGWNVPNGGPGNPPPPFNPPPPPPGSGGNFGEGGGNGGHIYEVPNIGPTSYEDYSAPAPNTGPPSGMIQLPKIGPNGLPVYPGQDGPTYPTLSQRVR
ncbi:unnamed protein product [Nippostrongylus brasiliensis]|uniref:IST1 homolog n=1 Tax=Nippostrongylus brasiliensis TaxID=27835 RepID=A0A0N4YFJ0_NIPBR|nr:unnamed protein product [Nippostrongylus brasiliensis]